MSDPRRDAIAARLTLPERRAFKILTVRTAAEVRATFHMITNESAQRVLDAVAEWEQQRDQQE